MRLERFEKVNFCLLLFQNKFRNPGLKEKVFEGARWPFCYVCIIKKLIKKSCF